MSAARITTAILYVEDDPLLREIAAMTLEDEQKRSALKQANR